MNAEKTKRLVAALVLLLAVLFILRFALGLVIDLRPTDHHSGVVDYSARLVYNEASNITYRKSTAHNQQKTAQSVNDVAVGQLQVYAKEANLAAYTKEYEQAIKKVRQVIADHEAVIRIERIHGTKPNRSATLIIRSPVDAFDPLVAELRQCAPLASFSVTKEDQTAESQNMLAELKSQEAFYEALAALRQAQGKVDEMVRLEEKILGVRSHIEQLKANVDTMIGDEPHHNVRYSLTEDMGLYVESAQYPLTSRVLNAGVWAVKYWLLIIFLFGIGLALRWSVHTITK